MPTSHTEQLGRDLIHHYLLGFKTVYGIRPKWLTWPETGRQLELDIYLPDLKLAIEIQGIQHGRPVIGMQRDLADFERQQARDLWKLETCYRLGINLFQLTVFDLTEQRFPTKLRQIIDVTLANQRLDQRVLYDLQQVRYHLSIMSVPRHLYDQADRLSRQKFRPSRPKRGSWWRRLLASIRRPKGV